jgi:DnaJ-class molecular chaperone
METTTLTFRCARGQNEALPDCAHPDTWKAEAVRGEYGTQQGRLLVLASAATCPDCGGSGEAESDETVYLITDEVLNG